jgi:hypothetical protein
MTRVIPEADTVLHCPELSSGAITADVSTHEPQAWFLLSGEEETSALNHPWPESRVGGVEFVVDEALGSLGRNELLGLYQDLAEKMLAVFRELVPPGESLYALDYHHDCYRLFPHVPFEKGATLEEMTGNYTEEHFQMAQRQIQPPPFASRWPVTIQPDGDPAHWFAPPDFRFVYSARYTVQTTNGQATGEVETYELQGREFVEAVERNMPKLFRLGRRLPVTE